MTVTERQSCGPSPGSSLTGQALDVAADFAARARSGSLDLPLPGSGRTGERWAALAALAAEDLSLARLSEGHADAIAILAELGGEPAPAGSIWGVWAAQPPGPSLSARRHGRGWQLDGVKQYCSGAHTCTNAIVTASTSDGPRLFTVRTDTLAPIAGTWPASGMSASDTFDMRFSRVAGEPVGAPGAYTERPGFAHGGAGVAACWFGGARAIGETLLAAARHYDVGPHALAHLGSVDVAISSASTVLNVAAADIDGDPLDRQQVGRLRALRVRALIEATATEVMAHVGRALGAGPLCHNELHGRRVADLTVYLRQHHAERNLAELGTLVAESLPAW
jgi:alkylation response protein AidB-like acyl-CoA dehydrogenase